MAETWTVVWHPDGDFSKKSTNRHVTVMGSVIAPTRAEAESRAFSKYPILQNCIIAEFNPKAESFKDEEMIRIQADCSGHDHGGLIGIYRSDWCEQFKEALQKLQDKAQKYRKPKNVRSFDSLEVSIKKRVIKTNGGCWLWSGAQSKGYGTIAINKKRILAHRYIYNKLVGQIPSDLLLRHSCDNRMCVSPHHLAVGTALDNAKDRAKKNRGGSGYSSEAYFVREDPVEGAFHSIPPEVRKTIRIEYYRQRIPKYKLEKQYKLCPKALNEILSLLSVDEQKVIYNSIKRGHAKVFEIAKDKLIENTYVYEIMMKYLTKRDMVKIRIQHYSNGKGLRKLSNIYCIPYKMIKSIIQYNKITIAFGNELSKGKVILSAP